ncbi:MAG TPA: NAD-dependent epimerase/dehydratase family protein [Verrucomicrobiae bacterium]|nr:NAD-dependent epimerase/dehydratase family protein [Verrucomicrobiae bacterium]
MPFYLAAMTSVPESMQKPVECNEINTAGTLIILEEAARARVKKLVFSSSAAIYGDNPVTPKVETMLPEPKSPYAITKLDGEYEKYLGVSAGAVPADCLRLELNPKCFWLFSYHHLDFATFESTQGEDVITMSFLNRTVRLKGKNLRELGLALQSRTVEVIRPMPERYAPLSVGRGVWVKAIEIENAKEQSG